MIPIQQVEAENIPWDEVEKADEFVQKHEKCTLETVRIKGLRLHPAAQDNGKGYLLGRLKQAELEKLLLDRVRGRKEGRFSLFWF